MKRLWIAIGILAMTSAYGIPTCPAHGEEHGGGASSTRSAEGVRFVDFTLRDPDGVPVTFGNLFIGITSLFLGPEASLTWHENLSAELAADFPIVENNTSLQIVPDYRLRGAVDWRY